MVVITWFMLCRSTLTLINNHELTSILPSEKIDIRWFFTVQLDLALRVVWTTLNEEYDPLYNYTYDESTLIASKGDLIVLDDAEEKRKDDEWKAIKYRDERRLQYPDIGDQLDDLYKKGAFSDEMAAKIKAVKDNNPKP